MKLKDLHFDDIFSFTVTGVEASVPSIPFSMPTVNLFSPEGILTEGPTDGTTTTTANGDSQERLYNGLNNKLIHIYCSILAAVVVGLVAFIIFKR